MVFVWHIFQTQTRFRQLLIISMLVFDAHQIIHHTVDCWYWAPRWGIIYFLDQLSQIDLGHAERKYRNRRKCDVIHPYFFRSGQPVNSIINRRLTKRCKQLLRSVPNRILAFFWNNQVCRGASRLEKVEDKIKTINCIKQNRNCYDQQ